MKLPSFLKISTWLTTVLATGSLPVFSHAEENPFQVSGPFYELVSRYYNIGIGLAIISSILVIIFGGYRMVTSAGKPSGIESGKKMIFNALFGLTLALLSAVLLNFLNPRILNPGA
jgi:hypothetical protein